MDRLQQEANLNICPVNYSDLQNQSSTKQILSQLPPSSEISTEYDPFENASFFEKGVAVAIKAGLYYEVAAEVGLVRAGVGFWKTASNLKLFASDSERGLGVNPFKGLTFEEIDNILSEKGFRKIGPDPVNGKGSYFHPETGRKYYLDQGGMYKEGLELPHVDVHRMENGVNLEKLGKRRYPTGDSLFDKNENNRGYNVNF